MFPEIWNWNVVGAVGLFLVGLGGTLLGTEPALSRVSFTLGLLLLGSKLLSWLTTHPSGPLGRVLMAFLIIGLLAACWLQLWIKTTKPATW